MPAPIPLTERVLPALVAATVLAFAAGSSSIPRVLSAGHPVRWGVLLLLLAAAAWGARLELVPRAPALAAIGLVALAALSTAWSVAPRTTFAKAGSLALLFAVCLLLAARAVERPRLGPSLLWGVIVGAALVAVAGILLLAVHHDEAVVAATYESPARFRGFGQDPNTVALLFGLTAPLSLWALLAGRRRALAAVCLALFVGSIVASGSRGGLASAAAGCLVAVVVLAQGRRALALAGIVVAAAVIGAAVQSLPSPSSTSTAAPVATAPGPTPKAGYLDADASYPLDADVGRPLPGGGEPPVRRTFFGASGRSAAWRGAVHQAAQRPVVGYGFGTEQRVFVDRYYAFVGGLPENSYIGLALQLGAVGLLALIALVAVLVRGQLHALHGRWEPAAAGLAVLAAGLVAAVAQSYLYSVGNIAAAALWIPAFLGAAGGGDG